MKGISLVLSNFDQQLRAVFLMLSLLFLSWSVFSTSTERRGNVCFFWIIRFEKPALVRNIVSVFSVLKCINWSMLSYFSASRLLKWVKNYFTSSVFLLYEQVCCVRNCKWICSVSLFVQTHFLVVIVEVSHCTFSLT